MNFNLFCELMLSVSALHGSFTTPNLTLYYFASTVCVCLSSGRDHVMQVVMTGGWKKLCPC